MVKDKKIKKVKVEETKVVENKYAGLTESQLKRIKSDEERG